MALQRSFRLNQVLRVVLSECKNSSIKIRTIETETQAAVKPKEKFLQRWGKLILNTHQVN